MKHAASTLIPLLLLGTGCASAGDPSRPVVRYETCAEMHADGWPGGVRSRWITQADFERPDLAEGTTRRAGVTRHEHRVFQENEHLDTDRDGHACEVGQASPTAATSTLPTAP